MKTTNKAAILLCAIAMSVASQGALADTHPCAAQVDAVSAAIIGSDFDSGNGPNAGRDQERMLQKVQEVINKLHAEKYEDAIGKLMDIADKADALASSPKQKLADDSYIQSAVTDAMVCINGLYY